MQNTKDPEAFGKLQSLYVSFTDFSAIFKKNINLVF